MGVAIIVIFVVAVLYFCDRLDSRYRRQELLKQSQERLKKLEEKSKLTKL